LATSPARSPRGRSRIGASGRGPRAALVGSLGLLLGLLLASRVFAAGADPFPRTRLLGWTPEGTAVTLTMTALGRGEVLVGRPPGAPIPVKTGGLCGNHPRWACKLELDPQHPEREAESWVQRVRQELRLIEPVPGLPPTSGSRPRHPAPGGHWQLEASDDATGSLPLVELLWQADGLELRYLAWQATFPLDPEEPLRLQWHPSRPLGFLTARSADRPHPREELVATLDLTQPIEVEDRAVAGLAAALADRPVASVKLAALIEEVRSRAQRRVELGGILRTLLRASCAGERPPVVLEAVSFDWSASERGALLTWGCPAGPSPAHGGLLPSFTLFRRERGRWAELRTLTGQPGVLLQLRQVDVTQDTFPEVWIREQTAAGQASFTLLGWRSGAVEELLRVAYQAVCRPVSDTVGVLEEASTGDPEGKGVEALLLRRRYFGSKDPAKKWSSGSSCSGAPLQEEVVVWRWNSRLARLYKRVRVLSPPGAAPLVAEMDGGNGNGNGNGGGAAPPGGAGGGRTAGPATDLDLEASPAGPGSAGKPSLDEDFR